MSPRENPPFVGGSNAMTSEEDSPVSRGIPLNRFRGTIVFVVGWVRADQGQYGRRGREFAAPIWSPAHYSSAGPPGDGCHALGGRIVGFVPLPSPSAKRVNIGIVLMRPELVGRRIPVGRRCGISDSSSTVLVGVAALPAE
jgi:hypothetical protein